MVFLARPFSTVTIDKKESMAGLSKSFVCFILRRQDLMEKLTQGLDPVRVFDLRSELVGHVKNVGDLINIRGDLGDMNGQAKPVQAVRDREQHADAVLGKDLDDGKIIR